MSKFGDLVKMHRMTYHESQEQYAKRFGFTSGSAVSLWEAGLRKVPENVLEAIIYDRFGNLPQYSICEKCNGAGVIRKDFHA